MFIWMLCLALAVIASALVVLAFHLTFPANIIVGIAIGLIAGVFAGSLEMGRSVR